MIMSDFDRSYTVAEAAAVSGIGIKSVNNAIDKHIIETVTRSTRRELSDEALLRLKLWYGVGSTLSTDRRQKLFDSIKAEPMANEVRADDLIIVDVAKARKQVASRVKDLDEAASFINRKKGVMGGEPVFAGTRIPVHLVASMLATGADEADILEGYPKLTARMLELAKIWVAAHPRRGRPKSLKDQGLTTKSTKRLSWSRPDHSNS
jgi:uncharacterized protein (DUF433 family)